MFSYWHTPDPRPMEWLTIPQLIDQWAESKPDDEAYVVRMKGAPREAVTFKQLKEKTEALASELLKLGLKAGDFVLITGITCLNWILTDLACTSVGIITVRCGISVLTKEGLLSIANRHKIKALFFHPGEKQEFYTHLKNYIPQLFDKKQHGVTLCDDIQSLQVAISLRDMPQKDCESLLDINQLLNLPHEIEEVQKLKSSVQSECIATVFLTSGSTGFPKAVPNTHFEICNGYKHSRLLRCFQENDRMFSDRSLSWSGSYFHTPVVLGYAMIYVHPLVNASDNDIDFSIQVIDEESVSCAYFLQYMVIDLLESIRCRKADPFKLRWVMIGGETMPQKIVQDLGSITDCVLDGYGSTEAWELASCQKDDTNSQYAGLVQDGVEVAVIGVPDSRLGENICACIIPTKGTTLTSDDMLRCFDDMYKTDEGLGMTPAYFMFLNKFPTVNAKIDRKGLKKLAVETFRL